MTDEADTLEDRLARLESVIEDQQETIEQQSDRIEELEAGDESDASDTGGLPVSRRTAIQTGGVLGLLGLGAGAAGAQGTGNIGTPSNPLEAVYTASLDGPIASDTVNVIAGDGLDIAENELEVDAGLNLSIDEGTLKAASQSEWEVSTDDYISPLDDTVQSVDLEGRVLTDTTTDSGNLYEPGNGLRSSQLDQNFINIQDTEIPLGESRDFQHDDFHGIHHFNHHAHGFGFVTDEDTYNVDSEALAGSGLRVNDIDELETTTVARGTIEIGGGQAISDNAAGVTGVTRIDDSTVRVSLEFTFSDGSEVSAFAQGRNIHHSSLRCQPDAGNNSVVIVTADTFGNERIQFVAHRLPPVT